MEGEASAGEGLEEAVQREGSRTAISIDPVSGEMCNFNRVSTLFDDVFY